MTRHTDAAPLPLLERMLRNRYAIERLLQSPAALILPAHIRSLIDDNLQLSREAAEAITTARKDPS